MNETEISEQIIKANEKLIRECPYCHTGKVESMGIRSMGIRGDKKTVRRFRCKNPDCLKSHSRDAVTGILTGEIKEPESTILIKNQRANKHLNVTELTLGRVRGVKIHERETDDDVLCRLLDIYYFKKV